MNKQDSSFSLKSYNTFGLDVGCSNALVLNDPSMLAELTDREEVLIIGGGSNILLLRDVEVPVVINSYRGITEKPLGDEQVLLEVNSGENWHDVVMYAVERSYGGIENLSLIPGSAGAAPMQNIGAYGVEIKNVLEYVEAVKLSDLSTRRFTNDECEFGYRESIFKHALKGKYFISRIGMRLKTSDHELNTSYGAIEEQLEEMGVNTPTIADVSKAVIAIRSSKLPDPKELGNAGSFFKNPVVSAAMKEGLEKEHPDLKSYPQADGTFKIPAAWLIDSLGWKGKRIGQCGSHEKQALVLVNYGGASGQEIFDLSEKILQNVKEVYGIQLQREVNILP